MHQALQVNELFTSIQGESRFAGLPCFFIRLMGCPLRCVWCDNEYAFFEGKNYTIEQLLEESKKSGCHLVEVTGGEPLAQKETIDLLKALLSSGFTVLLETSGALPLKNVPQEIIKIVDLKCPGSGMAERNLWKNFSLLQPHDEIKCVISDREDYLWAKAELEARNLLGHASVIFSPVNQKLNPTTLANWILEDRLPVKIQIQLHKFLWPKKERGF